MTVLLTFGVGAEWQPVWIAVISAGGGAVAALVSWLIARRKSSGSIKTSEAETLWNVAERLIDRLTTEVEKLRERVAVVEIENEQLHDCKERLVRLEAEVGQLRRLTDDR